jgi:gamma-glutamyl hercynylcysteine S-oxide synthase
MEPHALDGALADTRKRLLDMVLDLDDGQWLGPRLPTVNPIRWEIAHVAWFQEKWVLRHVLGRDPVRADGDALYDSALVPHDTRWDLPLPSRSETLRYMTEILTRSREATRKLDDPKIHYFVMLSIFHEDMHAEALAYTRKTLGYREPRISTDAIVAPAAGPLPGDVEVPGGTYHLGAVQGRDRFVFDNEKWAHPVKLAPFRIARAPVTNEEYRTFVEAGGPAPLHWVRVDDEWKVKRYDAIAPLPPHHPVIHVSHDDALAYCAWAQRRLPTEAEWELAASGLIKRRFPWGDSDPTPEHANLDAVARDTVDVAAHPAGDSPFGCRQMIGNVWEWTATRFAPYPGFTVDPYKEYSEPWFHTPHMVLRGGAWPTRSRLLRNTWRNFYPPHRRDVFAGFRTCAL